MTEDSRAPRGGRRRDRQAHAAIVDATLHILGDTGYAGLTIEGVARRAGVGKTTIYRWWPSKTALICEAALSRVGPIEPEPLGGLRAELIALLTDLQLALSSPAVVAALSALFSDPDGVSLRERLFTPVRGAFDRVIGRAVDSGELSAMPPVGLMFETAVGMLTFRLGLGGIVPADDIETVVAILVAGTHTLVGDESALATGSASHPVGREPGSDRD